MKEFVDMKLTREENKISRKINATWFGVNFKNTKSKRI